VSVTRPWYEAAFARGYLDVYPHRDAGAARGEVAGLIERGLRGRVLDLGCGFGRHTLAMRAAGLDAWGLDLSRDLLAHARAGPGAERLAGRLVRGDFRRLPFRDASFDAVVMLFSSFGYFDDEQNGGVLDEIARVLAPGGTVVLDLMNPARVRATLVPESRTERGGRTLIERRRLVEGGRRVQKDVRLIEPDGAERAWREDVRLYDRDEIGAVLERRSLDLERVEGDFDGGPFGPRSTHQVVWARLGAGARRRRSR